MTTLPVFCSGLDVLRRLDDVLQRVRAVDDRAVLPRLDELLEEEDVFLAVLRDPDGKLPVADPPRPQRPERVLPVAAEIGRDEAPARLQRAAARRNDCLSTASKMTS